MKASELREALKALIKKHGDLDVGVFNGQWQMFEPCAPPKAVTAVAVGEDGDPDEDLHDDDSRLGSKFIGVGAAQSMRSPLFHPSRWP